MKMPGNVRRGKVTLMISKESRHDGSQTPSKGSKGRAKEFNSRANIISSPKQPGYGGAVVVVVCQIVLPTKELVGGVFRGTWMIIL